MNDSASPRPSPPPLLPPDDNSLPVRSIEDLSSRRLHRFGPTGVVSWLLIILIAIALPLLTELGQREMFRNRTAAPVVAPVGVPGAPATPASPATSAPSASPTTPSTAAAPVAGAGTPRQVVGPEPTLVLTGKYLLGLKGLLDQPPPAMMSQIDKLAKTANERTCAAVMAGELIGRDAALERLADNRKGFIEDSSEASTASELRAIDVLTRYYTPAATDGQSAAMSPDEIDSLRPQLGWFVSVAKAFGQPAASPSRVAILDTGRKVVSVIVTALVVAVLAILVGLGLLITGIVLLSLGKLRFAFKGPVIAARFYVEAFALFLVLFIVVSIIGQKFIPVTAPIWIRGLLLIIPTIVAFFWPLLRSTVSNASDREILTSEIVQKRGDPVPVGSVVTGGHSARPPLLGNMPPPFGQAGAATVPPPGGVAFPSVSSAVDSPFAPTPGQITAPRPAGALSRLRHDAGVHTGRGVMIEMIAGIGGYLAGLPLLLLGLGITWVLILVSGEKPTHPIQNDIIGGSMIGVFFIAAVFAPLAEELVFRGVLLAHLRGWCGPVIAGLISGLIFAAIHPQGWTLIPVLTIVGFTLAIIRQWRGSLIASVTAHALHNGLLVIFAMSLFN